MVHLSAAQSMMPQAAPVARLVHIRLAGVRDRGAVRRIECACFGQGRLLFGLWIRVGSPRATTWLAEADQRPAGYVIAYEKSLDGKRAMYVGGIGVLPRYRQCGIGTHLMNAVIAACGPVWLHVRAGNFPAIALYRSLGMQQARKLDGFYANGDDALVLAMPELMIRSP